MSDVDILALHRDILAKFDFEINNIIILKTKLQELKNTIASKSYNLSLRIKHNIENEIRMLTERINDIENEKSENFYIMESTTILDEYTKELKYPVTMNFMGKNTSLNSHKEQLIKEYLIIATKYTYFYQEPDVKTQKNIVYSCTNCESINLDISESNYICRDCGVVIDFIIHQSTFKDVERVNITTKYTYDPKVHFRDCINQFQGKQNSTIDKCVYNDIINEFANHGLLKGDDKSPNSYRFQNITKEHIYMFLKETGHSKHYEDIVLIYYNVTSKKPDDIGYLEPLLLNDFDTLTNIYDQTYRKDKKIERKNFINTQYVLFQLLKRHKYPCKKEDFNILKTLDRQSFHDEVCKELFGKLGWNFTALF